MSKILVVVYSRTGTCQRLADLLCDQLRSPMAEIFDARPRHGLLGYWRCLLDSWLRREPPIHYRGLPLDPFDAVVLIAPVWAGRLAGPMRTFVHSSSAVLPAVALVPVMTGAGAVHAIADVAGLTGRAPILAMPFTPRDIEAGRAARRASAFGEAMQAVKGAATPHPQAARAPHAF
jgi:flavodoxin